MTWMTSGQVNVPSARRVRFNLILVLPVECALSFQQKKKRARRVKINPQLLEGGLMLAKMNYSFAHLESKRSSIRSQANGKLHFQ